MRTTGGTRGADPAHRAPTTHACQVPIRSLPEDWLWCEAWCGNASLPKAKVRARVRVRVHRVRVRVRGRVRVRVRVRVRANPHLNPNLNQDDRPMQQPAHQGAQARPGSPAHIFPYLPISPNISHISPYLPKLEQARRLGGERWLALDSRLEGIMAKAAKEVGASTAAKDEL